MKPLVSCEQAAAAGAIKYFTGKPCPKGHVSERYVSGRVCVACQSYREYTPNRRRGAARHHLKKTYGLSEAEFLAMWEAQDRKCAICRCPIHTENRHSQDRASVDHCHTTGRIRALDCKRCNAGLGQFLDDPALLRAAAAYLEHHSKDQHGL